MIPYSGVRPAGMVLFHLPREIGSLGNAKPADLPVQQPGDQYEEGQGPGPHVPPIHHDPGRPGD